MSFQNVLHIGRAGTTARGATTAAAVAMPGVRGLRLPPWARGAGPAFLIVGAGYYGFTVYQELRRLDRLGWPLDGGGVQDADQNLTPATSIPERVALVVDGNWTLVCDPSERTVGYSGLFSEAFSWPGCLDDYSGIKSGTPAFAESAPYKVGSTWWLDFYRAKYTGTLDYWSYTPAMRWTSTQPVVESVLDGVPMVSVTYPAVIGPSGRRPPLVLDPFPVVPPVPRPVPIEPPIVRPVPVDPPGDVLEVRPSSVSGYETRFQRYSSHRDRHRLRRPRKREKEKKHAVRRAVARLAKTAFWATEMLDLVDVIIDSIPKVTFVADDRRRYGSPLDKLQYIRDNVHRIDTEAFIANLILNHVTDAVIGRTMARGQRSLLRANQKFGRDFYIQPMGTSS